MVACFCSGAGVGVIEGLNIEHITDVLVNSIDNKIILKLLSPILISPVLRN